MRTRTQAPMGTARICVHAVCLPVRVHGGPTTDTNGRADGASADVGGACRGPCLRAFFPVWGEATRSDNHSCARNTVQRIPRLRGFVEESADELDEVPRLPLPLHIGMEYMDAGHHGRAVLYSLNQLISIGAWEGLLAWGRCRYMDGCGGSEGGREGGREGVREGGSEGVRKGGREGGREGGKRQLYQMRAQRARIPETTDQKRRRRVRQRTPQERRSTETDQQAHTLALAEELPATTPAQTRVYQRGRESDGRLLQLPVRLASVRLCSLREAVRG